VIPRARPSGSLEPPAQRLLRWERGARPGPYYVTLLPTRRCNLHCAICWQRFTELDYSHEVADERFLRLVDECADMGAKEWVIAGGGEPMVRADLTIRICEQIRARDMNGIIQTNGVQLDQEHFRRLVRAGWARIAFSIDGHTREINDAIRSPGSFDRATDSVRRAVAIKREMGARCPSIHIAGVITNRNYAHLTPYVEFVHALGAEAVALNRLQIHGASSHEFEVPEDARESLEREIDKARRRAEELGLDHNLVAHSMGFPEKPSKRVSHTAVATSWIDRVRCFEPWTSVAIYEDGRVGPCCILWNEKASTIQNASLRDLWDSGYMDEIRESLKNGHIPAACAQCPVDLNARSIALRQEVRIARMTRAERLRDLAGKAISEARQRGLLSAVRAGGRWIKRRLDAPPDR